MIISIPLFAIRHGQIGGVESAIYNLVKGLHENGVTINLYYSGLDRLSPSFLAWARSCPNNVSLRKHVGLPGPKAGRFIEEALFELSTSDDFIVYPNYFLPPRLNPKGRRGVVIHDSQFKIFPEFFSSSKRLWLQSSYQHALKKADYIFLISEHEKRMIADHFGAELARRCHVIYNAIDTDRFSCAGSSLGDTGVLSQKYLLSVCHQFPHKNVKTLIQAFSVLADKIPDLHLYLVGKESPDVRSLSDGLDTSIRQRIRFFGFVSDGDLGALYSNASLFVLPSLYEGFGMPAVEALSYGVPTLLSDIPALSEIACGLARLVPSQSDPSVWAEAIAEALSALPTPSLEDQNFIRCRYSPKQVGARLLEAVNFGG